MTDTAGDESIPIEQAEPAATALADQVVVVSGGGRGLGAAISRAFLGQGACVAIGYHRSRDAAEVLAAEYPGRGFAVPLDVTAPDQIRQGVDGAAERFGEPVTTVVNNALVDFAFDGDAQPRADELDLPRALSDFVDHVVPELQRRGRFRTSYDGHTLRSHLGLSVPAVGAPARC